MQPLILEHILLKNTLSRGHTLGLPNENDGQISDATEVNETTAKTIDELKTASSNIRNLRPTRTDTQRLSC